MCEYPYSSLRRVPVSRHFGLSLPTGQVEQSRRLAVKRLIDLVGASILLAILSPVIILASLIVRLSMGKPILWKHVRPGKNGIPFTMYKFRSMRPPTQNENPYSTDSARLTPAGRLLRKTSVDELPELWNVLGAI